MKTIFLLIPQGYLLRNFVTSGIIDKVLASKNIRVVALTLSPEALNHLEYPKSKLIIEPFPTISKMNSYSSIFGAGKAMFGDNPGGFSFYKIIHRILRIRWERINANHCLKTLDKIYAKSDYIAFLIDCVVCQPFPRSRKIFDLLNSLAQRYSGVSEDVKSLFNIYKPDLVFSSNPTRSQEYPFLKYSEQLGITTIGMIKSWDTILTKGYIPVPLDYYLTWNQTMKSDLVRLHNLNEEDVEVTGVPQFDVYATKNINFNREEFLKQFGLLHNKKTILLATSSPQLGVSEPAIVDYLGQCFENDTSLNNVQLLVRLHPHDDMSRYEHINYPNVSIYVPGRPGASTHNQRFLDPDFLNHLRDMLFSSDIVMNTASTTSIEAAALDKPIINLAFDMEKTSYWFSCQRYYEFEHYKPVVESGAVKLANSPDELITLILRYLDNPHFEKEERVRLKNKMCFKLDGQSSDRVAGHMLALTNEGAFHKLPR